MNKKAQVLIISLWILVILAMLAISIGHRVSMALYMSRYQKDRLKTLYLAKAGINRAISEIKKDKDVNNYDTLKERWADNEDIFKKITLDENQTEFATVSYDIADENDNPKIIYGAMDEERKININTASDELLVALLEENGVAKANSVSNNIRAWRGDVGVPVPDYSSLGYTNKSHKFSNIEELILVKDMPSDVFNDLFKGFVTVHGTGKMNVNTASKQALEILVNSCVKKLEKEAVNDRDPQNLADRIIRLREEDNVEFKTLADLRTELENHGGLTTGQINILNKFQEEADTKSTCFYVISNGKIDKSNIAHSIKCIYDRDAKKIIHWYES